MAVAVKPAPKVVGETTPLNEVVVEERLPAPTVTV